MNLKSSTRLPAFTAATLAAFALASPMTASARTETCKATSDKEIASLFDRWNASLQTGDPQKVVANYATKSVLLPTLSRQSFCATFDPIENLRVKPDWHWTRGVACEGTGTLSLFTDLS